MDGSDRVAAGVRQIPADLFERLVGDELSGFAQIVNHHAHRAIDLEGAYRHEWQQQQNKEYDCESGAEVHR